MMSIIEASLGSCATYQTHQQQNIHIQSFVMIEDLVRMPQNVSRLRSPFVRFKTEPVNRFQCGVLVSTYGSCVSATVQVPNPGPGQSPKRAASSGG